jgi:hypothetical protein
MLDSGTAATGDVQPAPTGGETAAATPTVASTPMRGLLHALPPLQRSVPHAPTVAAAGPLASIPVLPDPGGPAGVQRTTRAAAAPASTGAPAMPTATLRHFQVVDPPASSPAGAGSPSAPDRALAGDQPATTITPAVSTQPRPAGGPLSALPAHTHDARPAVQRAAAPPPLTLASPPPTPAAANGVTPTIQTALAHNPPPAATEPVQPPPGPQPAAAPVQRALTGTSSPSSSPATDDSLASPSASSGMNVGALAHDQLDELARQLYGRISRRVKAELLLDRERIGTSADIYRR